MRKIKTINTMLIILVIIGSFLANVNTIVSIMPESPNNTIRWVVENQEATEIETSGLDFKLVAEIFDYFKSQAAFNGIINTDTVISSGILFVTQNILIVIGHGHFDSDNHYRIADYTQQDISRLAEQKQIVALLGCHSRIIELDNEKQLTYLGEIDLKTALFDVIDLLDWNISHEFLPSENVQLFDLDPGPGGNGWTIYNPPPLFNMQKTAYCPEYQITWNLNSNTAIEACSAFLYNHHMTAIHLTYEGEFLIETPKGSDVYYTAIKNVQYDIWNSNPGGVWDYLNFANLKINGVSKSQYSGCEKFYNFETEMMNALGLTRQESQYSFAANFIAIGACLLTAGAGGIAFAFLVTTVPTWLLWIAGISGILAVVIGITLIIIALVVTISAYYTVED